MTASKVDPRVYVTLRDLFRLRYQTRGLSLSSKHSANSLLSGRHASRIRGRGLNFEEIRAYQAGDDVRAIDWKVTARTRSPHTRVFREERDRPAVVLVDQRMNMYFGSQHSMKSVTAAHVAALFAWCVLDQGDRVGGVVLSDNACEVFRPERNQSKVTGFLKQIVTRNEELSADNAASEPSMLAVALERVQRLAKHDFLIVVVSDFIGMDAACHSALGHMARHNDLVGVLVHDPIASELPDATRMVVGDGEWQAEIEPGRIARDVRSATARRLAEVLSLQKKLQTPILPISAAEDALPQLHRLLGTA
ncbi:MAG: DUF58 domain-containing protein [Planctomycetota bacterium]